MLELRKDIFADERDDNLKEIGKGTQRQDMLGHITGTSSYFNDHKLQGMLHLKVVRSAQAHARLRRIDTTEAERSAGVRKIIRGGSDTVWVVFCRPALRTQGAKARACRRTRRLG